MDTLQCFLNDEPIPCNEICGDEVRFYLFGYGLLTIVFIFIILMRPVISLVIAKVKSFLCHVQRNGHSTVENTETSTQGIQCDIEIGMQHVVVINPDDTLQLSEIT